MAIIDSVLPDASLSQGDLLQGVSLYATDGCWKGDGGQPAPISQKICLVISRPCAVSHKDKVTVLAVEKFSGGIPETVKSFGDFLDFLGSARDGTDSPDVFYLGELPGKTGRYGARLDSVHTIHIPGEQDRPQFLVTHRIGRLHNDFVRDLHVRLFRAFATLGFDDVRWLSTDDLNLLITFGRKELAEAEFARLGQDVAQSKKQFSGDGNPGSPKAMQDACDKVQKIKDKLTPFEEELSRRQSQQTPQPTVETTTTTATVTS